MLGAGSRANTPSCARFLCITYTGLLSHKSNKKIIDCS